MFNPMFAKYAVPYYTIYISTCFAIFPQRCFCIQNSQTFVKCAILQKSLETESAFSLQHTKNSCYVCKTAKQFGFFPMQNFSSTKPSFGLKNFFGLFLIKIFKIFDEISNQLQSSTKFRKSRI